MAWAAFAVALSAIVLASVAGVRAGRWRPAPTAVSAGCVMTVVAAGTVLPFGPLVLLISALPTTVAVRSLSRTSNDPRTDTRIRGV